MTIITEAWLQEVAKSLQLPALSPAVVNALLPTIELQIRRLVQQAHKHQRRSKSAKLKVDHINLVLTSNHIEPVYGLHLRDALHEVVTPPDDKPKPSSAMVSLLDLAQASLPSCPIKPQLSLHWLAVQGVQPNIPENPRVLPPDLFTQLPPTLPKELQLLYARTVHIITTSTGSTSSNKSRYHPALQCVYSILQTDSAIQDLVPYFSRFLYHQIKANIRDLKVTTACIRVIRALDGNAAVTLEHHLTQLLPAIFTCVLSAKLTPKVAKEGVEESKAHGPRAKDHRPLTDWESKVLRDDESWHLWDHFALRSEAARLVAQLHRKYGSKIPDLLTRILKTYVEAFGEDKCLGTVYGGIVGIHALGTQLVQTVLLPQMENIHAHLHIPEFSAPADIQSTSLVPTASSSSSSIMSAMCAYSEERFGSSMCVEALQAAVGGYMKHSMQAIDTPWVSGKFTALKQKPAAINLCDSEEMLVPYFSVNSKQLKHCRQVF